MKDIWKTVVGFLLIGGTFELFLSNDYGHYENAILSFLSSGNLERVFLADVVSVVAMLCAALLIGLLKRSLNPKKCRTKSHSFLVYSISFAIFIITAYGILPLIKFHTIYISKPSTIKQQKYSMKHQIRFMRQFTDFRSPVMFMFSTPVLIALRSK